MGVVDMSRIPKGIPKLLESERLVLRCPKKGDGAVLNPSVRNSFDALKKWMPWCKSVQTRAESEKFCRVCVYRYRKRKEVHYLIFEKHTGMLIGCIGTPYIDWSVPHFEIAYWLDSGHTGRGYMAEAVQVVTKCFFEQLGAKRVSLKMDEHNIKSKKVAESCGFIFEGTLRNYLNNMDGKPANIRMYAKTTTS